MPRLRDIGTPPLSSFDTFKAWFQICIQWFSRSDRLVVTLTPSAVSANSTSDQQFTVTPLDTNDYVTVMKPTYQAGLGIVGTRVSATNELSITYMNNSGGSITPTSEDYIIIIQRHD